MTTATDDATAPEPATGRGGLPGWWLAAIGIFLLCALLRVGLADRHGLWADELFSLAMATGHSLEHPAERADPAWGDYVERPGPVAPEVYAAYLEHDEPLAGPGRVVRAVFLSDTSPPLYYLLLWGWTLLFGTSDAALRMMSIVLALAAFPVIWSIASRVTGRPAAIGAGLIYAVSPLCVFYSTEGRMYSLLWLLAACHLWLTLSLHEQDRRRGWLIAAWILTGAAGLLTHYFFAFVLCAGGLWLLIHPGRVQRWVVVTAGLASVLLVVPWFVRLPEILSHWRVTADWLNYPPYQGYNALVQTLLLPWQFLSVRGLWGVRVELDWLMTAVVVAVVALGIFKTGARHWIEPKRQLLWLSLLAACVGLLVFDLWRGTYVVAQPRYALAGLPAAFVLVGIALAQVPARPRWVLLAVIMLACLFGVRRIYINTGRQGEPFRAAADVLAGELEPGDLVIMHSIPSGVIGMGRYLQNAPEGVDYVGWTGQLDQRRMPEDLLELIAGRQRVIVIVVHEVGEPAVQLEWLREHAEPSGQFAIEHVKVYTFDLPDAEQAPSE